MQCRGDHLCCSTKHGKPEQVPTVSAKFFWQVKHVLIDVNVPGRFEGVIMIRRIFNGVFGVKSNFSVHILEPIDQKLSGVEMLRARQFQLRVLPGYEFIAVRAINFDSRIRAGTLADQFSGKNQIWNSGAFNAVVLHGINFD